LELIRFRTLELTLKDILIRPVSGRACRRIVKSSICVG